LIFRPLLAPGSGDQGCHKINPSLSNSLASEQQQQGNKLSMSRCMVSTFAEGLAWSSKIKGQLRSQGLAIRFVIVIAGKILDGYHRMGKEPV